MTQASIQATQCSTQHHAFTLEVSCTTSHRLDTIWIRSVSFDGEIIEQSGWNWQEVDLDFPPPHMDHNLFIFCFVFVMFMKETYVAWMSRVISRGKKKWKKKFHYKRLQRLRTWIYLIKKKKKRVKTQRKKSNMTERLNWRCWHSDSKQPNGPNLLLTPPIFSWIPSAVEDSRCIPFLLMRWRTFGLHSTLLLILLLHTCMKAKRMEKQD